MTISTHKKSLFISLSCLCLCVCFFCVSACLFVSMSLSRLFFFRCYIDSLYLFQFLHHLSLFRRANRRRKHDDTKEYFLKMLTMIKYVIKICSKHPQVLCTIARLPELKTFKVFFWEIVYFFCFDL